MQQAVLFITYRLVAGASVPDFLAASARVCAEHLSKQKGYVDWKQLRDGDTWADMLVWQTMQDGINASESGENEPSMQAFCAFLDMQSIQTHMYAVEQHFGR